MPEEACEFDPFATHLGITLDHQEAGVARTRMTVQPHHMHRGGVMQGGLLVTLADFAMARAVVPFLEDGQSITTVELKTNFIRPGMLNDEIEAEAKVIQRGRTVALVDMEVRSLTSKKVLLKGMGTCMFLNPPPAAAKKA